MYVDKKNDSVILKALKLANNNQHQQAAALYQQAGNQYRNPKEKAELWKAAERHRRIHNSD